MIQREWTPDDYIMMVRRRWLLILSVALVGGLGAYVVSRFLPNRYTSKSVVLVQQATVPTDFVRSVVTSGVAERLMTMRQQILSRTQLEPIIKQLGLFSADVGRESAEALVARLQSAITVTPMHGADENAGLPGFSISVTLDTPQTAQLVCSTVTSMFIEQNLKTREQHTEDTTQFLSQQMLEAKANLDEQDTKLAAFKSRYLGFLPEEVQTNLNLLSSLNSELDATTQAISRAQQDKSMAESMLSQQIASWRASQSGRNPDTYQEQLAALQIQLASLQTKYTDNHPDVIKTKTEIEAVKKKIAESDNDKAMPDQGTTSEPSQFRPLRAQILVYDQTIAAKTGQQARIQEQIKRYQDRVQLSPSIEQQYKALTRDYQTALDSYNDLSKKRTQSTIATDLERDQDAEQFRLMDAANLPNAPSFPNRPLFGLGGLAGGVAFGLGVAFLLEVRDTSLRTESDVENALELPVLAIVPTIDVLQQAGTDFQ